MKKLITFLLFAFFIIAEEEKNIDADPFEDINRVVFNVSDSLDEVLLKPTAQIYSEYTPLFLKDSVTNFFYNIAEIDTVINQLLQGKPKLAAQDSLRFLINTTIGIGGIFDIATRMGLSRHDEDFGQTLGYWGVPAGSYVFVPFVGPSTVRDLFGIPLSWYVSGSFAIEDEKTKIVFSFLDVIETRERILAAENLIVGDKYEFVKDVFLQSREHSVQDGEVEDEFLSEFEDELFD